MSRIFFDKSYVIVIPSYGSEDTKSHRHSMLHLFWGKDLEIQKDNKSITGNIICINSNVQHQCPKGEIYGFLLIDPTSLLAENITNDLLKNQDIVAINYEFNDSAGKSEQEILADVENMFSDFGLIFKPSSEDKKDTTEIEKLVSDIKEYQFLGKKISDVAEALHYSESYLSHIFKDKVGCSLKNYLMMCQMEYVWKNVSNGKSITDAAIEAGYSSPSHFAAICKQMTGISITQAEIM